MLTKQQAEAAAAAILQPGEEAIRTKRLLELKRQERKRRNALRIAGFIPLLVFIYFKTRHG